MPFVTIDHFTSSLPDDVAQAIEEATRLQVSALGTKPGSSGSDEEASFDALEPESDWPATPLPGLDRWDVQTHQYRNEITADVGFLGSLFSGKGERVSAGVVQEAKRYRIGQTKQGRSIEFGTAVRLSIATNLNKADFKLTIPNLAAGAQLSAFDARIGLSVIGFVGPLGDLLPAPSDLDVEKFSVFMEAFQKLQTFVFGKEGVSHLSPTFLGYDKSEESDSEE